MPSWLRCLLNLRLYESFSCICWVKLQTNPRIRQIVNGRFFSWCRVKTVSSARLTYHPHPLLTQEEARDARARAWAFVFTCWRAKREDGTAITPRRPEGERDKEVSHVDHSSVEPSKIVDDQFTKEQE